VEVGENVEAVVDLPSSLVVLLSVVELEDSSVEVAVGSSVVVAVSVTSAVEDPSVSVDMVSG
jgi:hypothetical protein